MTSPTGHEYGEVAELVDANLEVERVRNGECVHIKSPGLMGVSQIPLMQVRILPSPPIKEIDMDIKENAQELLNMVLMMAEADQEGQAFYAIEDALKKAYDEGYTDGQEE